MLINYNCQIHVESNWDDNGSVLILQDKLDPLVGRLKELERVTQILCKRRKNNPCLIGDPGVGKTVIVEGLAQNIIKSTIPSKLQGKKVGTSILGFILAILPESLNLSGTDNFDCNGFRYFQLTWGVLLLEHLIEENLRKD